MNIEQVSAGRVTPAVASLHQSLSLTCLPNLNIDGRVLELRARVTGGEQDGFPSQQHLRRAVGDLAPRSIQFGRLLRCASAGGNTEQGSPVGGEDDVTVFSPTSAALLSGIGEGNGGAA